MSEPGVCESEVDCTTTLPKFCVTLDKSLQRSGGGGQRSKKQEKDKAHRVINLATTKLIGAGMWATL